MRELVFVENQEYSVYDEVLNYLLSEGYAENEKSAEIIMVNMSECWLQNILEQGAYQTSLFTRSGKPQNFRGGRSPFVAADAVPRGRNSPLPPARPTPPRTSPGQLPIPGLRNGQPPRNPSSTPSRNSSSNRYRPGATIGSTGSPETYRRFPELARTNNPRSPRNPPSNPRNAIGTAARVLGTVASLRNATPFGVAAAVSAPRPTSSRDTRSTAPNIPDSPEKVKVGQTWTDYGTRTGPNQRAAQRLKVGVGIVGPQLPAAQDFNTAYGAAKRKNGMGSEFNWRGKSYRVY